ncbi:MAG: winged helix-turn-helix domain-containing protein, partial [Rhodospirillaceae bacterium]
LSGKGEEVNRIIGLEMGADDYVAKPFSSRELLARFKTVLPRSQDAGGAAPAKGSDAITFTGWNFDKISRKLTAPGGDEVPLTTMEFNLLNAFTNHPNQVLDRDKLLELLQNRSWDPYDRSIDCWSDAGGATSKKTRRSRSSSKPLAAPGMSSLRRSKPPKPDPRRHSPASP